METANAANTTSQTPATPSSEGADRQQWVSPGVSIRKRWLTGIGVALAAAVFFIIALSQGVSMIVSTIIGVVFIGCFVWYLRIVAPTPFTITIGDAAITRTEQGGEPIVIPWANIAKVKEECFKNGRSVSITVYKRVGERGLHRSWVAYRDDLPRFDALIATMQNHMPEGRPWNRERIHD